MNVLITYHGVVEKDGLVRLRWAPELPEGTEVVIVVTRSLAAPEEQERDLNALVLEDYHKSFERFEAAVAEERADVDVADISDEELVSVVHDAREHDA
jgi:hypothetical protein